MRKEGRGREGEIEIGIAAGGGRGDQELGDGALVAEGGVMQRGPPVGGIPRVDVGPLPLQQPLHLRGKGGGEVRTNSLVQRYSGAGIDAYWKLTGIDAYRNRRLQESTHNGKQSGARIDRAVSVRRNGTTASRALRMAVPCSRRGGDGAEGSGV